MPAWQTYLDKHRDRLFSEYLDFLRIASISALPQHAADVQKTAEWTANRLKSLGVEHVSIMPTGGHPVVYGDWLHAPGRQTVLIYGHFDVQPVDPLHLWTAPPFEPTVRDGRVYARGASDNKGNMYVALAAVEALLKAEAKLPVNVKFLFEGQEEIGSPQMPAFIAANKKLLASDVILSSDSGQLSESEPALLLGIRGICGLQVDMVGASSDLHSGLYGGVVNNPLHAMAALLASLHTADGRVAVQAFYDKVVNLSAVERKRIADVPFAEAAYKKALGVDALFGEAGYSPVERGWIRPTLEINGMWGGFQGAGTKTVLPNEAHAKITCRLVADQDPREITKLVEAHVKGFPSPGIKATVSARESMGYPYLMPADHPGNVAAIDVLKEMYGREPYHIRTGGSVPIVPAFLRELGVYTVSFGFGLDDERFHAPDEFFRVSSFERGQVGWCKFLHRLAR